MEKNQVTEALKRAKEVSSKRNFNQSVDLIINLKGLDLKKQEQQLDIFANLHYSRGKKISVCALIGAELQEQAKACDEFILVDDFAKFSKKSEIKKLANKHDFFVAQATIMPKVAATFGIIVACATKKSCLFASFLISLFLLNFAKSSTRINSSHAFACS